LIFVWARRLVVHPALERLRTILLTGRSGWVVVRVHVALAVPEPSSALVVGVAQVQGHFLVDA